MAESQREIRCPGCGHWIHHRPGDVYGCGCGCFTRLAESAEEAEALASQLRASEPDREVVVDYD